MPQGAVRAGVDAGERGGTIKKAACEARLQDTRPSTPLFAHHRGPQAASKGHRAPGHPNKLVRLWPGQGRCVVGI